MTKVRKILSYKLKKVFICDRIQRYLKNFAGVAEWQTQQTQNLSRATSCGFDSHHQHQTKIIRELVRGLFLFVLFFLIFSLFTLLFNPDYFWNKKEKWKMKSVKRRGFKKVYYDNKISKVAIIRELCSRVIFVCSLLPYFFTLHSSFDVGLFLK